MKHFNANGLAMPKIAVEMRLIASPIPTPIRRHEWSSLRNQSQEQADPQDNFSDIRRGKSRRACLRTLSFAQSADAILRMRANNHSPLPLLLIIICFLFHHIALAQSAGERAVAGVGEIKPLQIGDTIPEELWHIPLQVVNHPEGKDTITLNDYRDKKLIILDFWATWCGACLEAFPLIEKYNELFAEDIIIISVNSVSTKNSKEQISSITSIKENNINNKFYSLYEDKYLEKYFPWTSLPQLIWIKDGKRFEYSTYGTALTRSNILNILANSNPKMLSKLPVGARRDNQPTFITDTIGDDARFYFYFGGFTEGLNFSTGRYYEFNKNQQGTLYKNINSPLITMYQQAFSDEFAGIQSQFVLFEQDVDTLFRKKLYDPNTPQLCCFELYHRNERIENPLKYLKSSLMEVYPYLPQRKKKVKPIIELKWGTKLSALKANSCGKEIYTDGFGNTVGNYSSIHTFLFLLHLKTGISMINHTGVDFKIDFVIPNNLQFNDLGQLIEYLQCVGFKTNVSKEERDFLVFTKTSSN